MSKPKVILLGKLPPPYYGPAVATRILLDSSLGNHFQLIHVSTKLNNTLSGLGGFDWKKPFKLLLIYFKLFWAILFHWPAMVVVPISQTRAGFTKDAPLIIISWLLGRKVLLQLRGSDFKNWIDHEKPNVRKWVEKQLKRSFGVVVLGNNLRYLFEPYFPVERIYVVPNGGNYEFPEVTGTNEKVKVLYLANLLETKGVFEVIKAIDSLKDMKHQFECELVGSWQQEDFKNKCLDYIAENGIEVQISRPKSGAEKMQTLADADIFVFPPNAPEGHPWVLVEALAAGLPIVSTNQGAIIESVLHSENGFIVSPNAPDEIASNLKKLIIDEALRTQMAARSRAHYKAHFTEESMVKNYVRVFNDIISRA